ncbi:protein rep, partial [Salmonella enterica]|uniref:protein rep n=1 Tax=Salmonella enterica TaxID=28901 RepID=UPI0022BD19E7|nr:protein rep [Salmonella enterica]
CDFCFFCWFFFLLFFCFCVFGLLGETLSRMNLAFQRVKDRKEFRAVQGWIRTTEVTGGSDGSADPHFHTLMMVAPSMFTRDYVKDARWV